MSSCPCIGNQGLNKESALGGNGVLLDDGSKTQCYVVILDQLQDCSGGLERAPESRIRGPLTLLGLTTLNQALIRTPTPNLMGVIQSESMISQAFQACYSIEGCPSDRCILAPERIGYMIENIYQLNLSPRSPLTYSRKSHLQPQELLR